MKKDEFNLTFKKYAQTVAPQPDERDLISRIYQSFNTLFGENNCIQIGSYPRFTAITPIHDLDLLYFLGKWDDKNHSPLNELEKLETLIENDYKNPTDYEIKILLQTHSITVSYLDDGIEVFSVDIVPAYIFDKNEFKEDTYKVPEVLGRKHGKRRIEYYKELCTANKEMDWITSDPRGYIKVASDTDKASNGNFRKVVKIIKVWKNNLADKDQNLKLKSFHLEQVVTKFFQDNQNLEIFDAIFKFFVELPDIVDTPNQINDRADNDKFIDDYIADLTKDQKEKIKQARDCFLIKLEEFSKKNTVKDLLEICFYSRFSSTEQFLFDFKIPTLIDDNYSFEIRGEVQERRGGFRSYILDKIGLIVIDRKIKFRIRGEQPDVDLFKWKVKNDNSSRQPRGEITDYHTLRDPEETRYFGEHYVECYAILNNTCVSKAKQNVKLNPQEPTTRH